MKKDLRSHKRNSQFSQQPTNAPPQTPPGAGLGNMDQMKMIEMLQSKSPEDLQAMLFQTTQAQKREGTFDAEGLKRSVEGMSSMLPAEQRQRMMEMIAALSQRD